MNARMIFHAPFALEHDAASASGIRPVRMRDAFVELGYEVTVVAGDSRQRKAAIRDVEKLLSAGESFDLCYSESSTMPMTMTDPHHLPLRPTMDFAFFRRLRRAGTPVGHFLRDLFWAFPEYRRRTRFPKREAALLGYHWDVRNYRSCLDRLYVPSLGMGDHLDVPAKLLAELPPGHGWEQPTPHPREGVRLFYVGGVGAHYRLHRVVEAVHHARTVGADVTLTLCAPGEQWRAAQPEYQDWVGDGVQVVEGHGARLRSHIEAANVGVLAVEPQEYWGFAAPVKLFDYLGAGLPVLASDETYAGALVDREGWGWSVPYEVDALTRWLVTAAGEPSMLMDVRPALDAARPRHTWRARAEQVVADLTQ